MRGIIIIPLIPLLLFCSSWLSAGTVEREYTFSAPMVTRMDGWSHLHLEGARIAGETGRPLLPVFPVKLLLPPGEIAASVSVIFMEEEILSGKHILAPAQACRPLSYAGDSEWFIDQELYQRRTPYPESRNHTVRTHFLNGSGIALSYFTPVRYYPADSVVSWFKKVKVVIATQPDPNSREHLQNFYPAVSKRNLLESMVQNPEMAGVYYSGRENRSPGYDYLILTSSQFAAEFDTLALFYLPRGIKTEIHTKEQISATMAGSDLQEKIRNFIIQEYQNEGIQYVLIGGDAEIMPYRGFYCQVLSGGSYYTDNGIPADLYYSALDGNWNTDGDNLWGEPNEDDLFPELGVGRMPFSDSGDLQNMLHKTMRYQSDPVEGELTRPLLAGEHLYNNPLTWGSDYMRMLVGLRTVHGYTTRGIPPAHPRDTLYDTTGYSWTKSVLMARINAGRPWVHHTGHASQITVMKMNIYDITSQNFAQANGVDHSFPVVYTHGCDCGAFDASDCIGERMVTIDNFAAAFIGNSRYGWFNEGTTDGPSQHLHREFMDALYRDSLFHLGSAHMKSKSETAPFVEMGEWEPGATRWCFYDNNLLGDPLMAAWTDEPAQIEVTYNHLIPIGIQDVQVNMSGLADDLSGITCSLFRNDTLFGTTLTGANGQALIPAEYFLHEGPVWLVVTGYNLLPQWHSLEVSDYWLGNSTDWSDPQNWFSGTVPDQDRAIIIPSAPQGGFWPLSNSGSPRKCRAVQVEPGAVFSIQPGDSFTIHQQ